MVSICSGIWTVPPPPEVVCVVFVFTTTLNSLEIDTDKLDSLNEFATTNTIGSAVGGIVNAITAPIEALGSAIGGGGEQSNELAEIKSILQQILNKETNIYMDATKVGTGFAVGTSKVQ